MSGPGQSDFGVRLYSNSKLVIARIEDGSSYEFVLLSPDPFTAVVPHEELDILCRGDAVQIRHGDLIVALREAHDDFEVSSERTEIVAHIPRQELQSYLEASSV